MGMFRVWKKLTKLSRKQETQTGLLTTILQRLERFMSQTAQDLENLRKQIDQATNAVAARIDRLTGQIKNSMTDEEVAAIKAGFQAESDRLNTLGQDPVNPVPPE